MNYIMSQIDRKIKFLKADGQKSELRVYYQAKFEFILVYIMSYLWNKNWSCVSIDSKEYITNNILKPSIGSIVSIVRMLDYDNIFFGNKKIKRFYQILDSYPNFRNEKIGHGYSYEDDNKEYLTFFETFFDIVYNSDIGLPFTDVDMIKVTKEELTSYKGISFKPDGATYLSWTCPKQTNSFSTGDLYIYTNQNEYIRISPFVRLESESEFYIFSSIEEKLTGRTKFNRLLKTASLTIEIPEFETLSIATDNSKRKSANGTVVNLFENNYKKYIDIGITKKIIDFLENNRSSVFATIWGHGGVGKTASIQRVCEILCNQDKKTFDYIIFISAKDRYYNYYQGKINPIIDSISSLEAIMSMINSIIFNNNSLEYKAIIKFSGKLLLIIDDFETFSRIEKERIVDFIKRLDIDHHKVVLTTRAATLITGEEIQTKELNADESVIFLQEAIKNELPNFDLFQLQKELTDLSVRKKVYEITSGRPLFILQLGIFAAQKGTLVDALSIEIKSTKEAINFLYDRIYDYLSNDSKNMFLGISLLVDENDLTGLISNLKFILNKEDKEEEFQISLNELIKLRIITVEDKDFFKVYSPEIYKLMKLYYQEKGPEFDGNINNRFNLINTEKGSTTEIALLENADASRLMSTEEEVENKYRYILNREKAPYNIKRTALLNFASYLVSHKGKLEKALKLFSDYYQLFRKDPIYIKSYSTYLWMETENEIRVKAVSVIQDYFMTKPGMDQETYMDLLGILTMYKCMLIVNERDELKLQLRQGEISNDNYRILYREQRERLKELMTYPGGRLFSQVKDLDLMSVSPNCRNSVLDGLTHFVEITIRNGRRDIGRQICKKIIDEMPQNYQKPFIFKLNKIQFIENSRETDIELTNVLQKEPTSDLGLKLKEAFLKIKDC